MRISVRIVTVILTAILTLGIAVSLSGQPLPRSSSDSFAPPYLVKDFREVTQSSDPECIVFQDRLLCSADDGIHGRELWISDGTESGTYLMADMVPGEDSWLYDHFYTTIAPDGEYVLFQARPGNLWRTDGTEAGTVAIRDSESGEHLYAFGRFVRGDVTYLSAHLGPDYSQGYDLWVTDGTDAGTRLVKELNPDGYSEMELYYAKDMGSYFVFRAYDGTHGHELWRSDGTEQGTRMVKDVRPGPDSGYPNYFTKIGNVILFVADDGVHGRELWRSDGTEQGTWMVKDIRSGQESWYPDQFTELGNVILFGADDGVHGEELWRSDGTEEGTWLVKDMQPGPASSMIGSFVEYDGELYFLGGTTDSRELWQTDGTSEGTYNVAMFEQRIITMWISPTGLLAISHQDATGRYESSCWLNHVDLSTGDLSLLHVEPFVDDDPGYCYMFGPAPFEGVILFAAETETEGLELWQTDGTATGTHLVADIWPGPASASPSWPHFASVADIPLLGDKLYLSANHRGGDRELWSLDLEVQSAERVADINQQPSLGHLPTVVLGMNEDFTYLLADSGSYRGLFRTDGSPEGTFPLIRMSSYASDPTPLAKRSGYATDGTFWLLTQADQLYKSKGTQESTEMFWEFDTYSVFTTDFAVVGDTVYVSAPPAPPDGSIDSMEISMTNGESVPQQLIYFERADRLQLVALSDDVLLFYREGYSDEHELWRSEGTSETTTIVTKIDIASTIFEWKNETYFCGKRPEADTFGLWKSDGTEPGTTELVANQRGMSDFAATDEWLYYAIHDPYAEVPASVWRTDGTAAGSHQIPHDFGVTDDDHIESFLGTGDLLYLVVSNNVRESLWVTDGTQQGTRLLHAINRPEGASYNRGFTNLVRADDKVVFATDKDNSLWITDGTIDGTTVLLAEAPAHAYDPFGNLHLRGYWNDLVLFADLYAQPLRVAETPSQIYLPAVLMDE